MHELPGQRYLTLENWTAQKSLVFCSIFPRHSSCSATLTPEFLADHAVLMSAQEETLTENVASADVHCRVACCRPIK